MTRVYPSNVAERLETTTTSSSPAGSNDSAAILTVWKKSLLFNCNGFTVFDGKGNLVFRVDNYVAGNKGEIVLMDATGKPILTIRRKIRLSLGDNWLVYDGESAVNPLFLARKYVNILNTKYLANVSLGTGGSGSSSLSSLSSSGDGKNVFYEIEGCFAQRCCVVLDKKRRRVAEIKPKEPVGEVAFGLDVFRLIVQPEIDAPLAMALVIILDQMFGSSRRLMSK